MILHLLSTPTGIYTYQTQGAVGLWSVALTTSDDRVSVELAHGGRHRGGERLPWLTSRVTLEGSDQGYRLADGVGKTFFDRTWGWVSQA